MDRKKRNDIILIAVLLIAAAAFLLVRGAASTSGNSDMKIIISVEDTVVFEKNSNELKLPYTIDIEGSEHGRDAGNRGHNTFVIDRSEDGSIGIRCTEADCPDKICVDTGRVTVPDQPVVCLPHRATARLQ